MKHRLIYGLLGTIITIILVTFSTSPYFSPIFGLLASLAISVTVWEYYEIAKNKGFEPLSSVGMIASLLYTFSLYLTTQLSGINHLPVIVLFLSLAAGFAHFLRKGSSPFANLAISTFAIAYLTVPLSFIISINYEIVNGSWWLIYLIAVSKITDAAAFFIGKRSGKHKLCPAVSPNKTWEGAVAGLAFGILTSLCFTAWLPQIFPISLLCSFFLGAVISIVAQFGDLAESLLKRDVGVKDSNQLPGLGGALDMADSLVFTTPLLYTVLMSIL